MRKIIQFGIILGLLFGISAVGIHLVGATSVFTSQQGGVGISTSTSASNGYNLYQISVDAQNHPIYGFQANGGGGGGVSTSSPTIGFAYFVNGNTISGTSSYVSAFNGATGSITYAPSTTIPVLYVSSFNGSTGAVNGVASLNLIYGNLSLAVRASGTVPSFEGGGAPFYINIPASGTDFYAPSTTIPVLYVSSFNGNTGAVVFSSAPTSTINGYTGTVFDILAGSGLSRSVVNGSTTFYGVATSTSQRWTANNYFSFVSSTQTYSASTSLQDFAANALVWADATGKLSAYGGTGCAAGTAGLSVNASGTWTCTGLLVSTSTANRWTALQEFSVGGVSTTQLWVVSSSITNASTSNVSVSGYLQITGPNSIKDSGGNNYSTSTAASLAGKYLGVSGSQLTASTTLASTTAATTNWDATTTAQYRYFLLAAPNYPFTLASFSCENVFATTTYEIIRTTDAVATSGVEIVPSITCSAGVKNTTTTFANSTLADGQFMVAAVTSTVGTPTRDSLWWAGTK